MDNLTPQGRNDEHVFDHSKVTDQIYIGSDLCKAGVCKIHGEEFRAMGVTSEINLSAENNELPPKNLDSYTWLPVVDGHAPSMMQLETGTSIMHDVVSNGGIVYVHCRNGHGRSPALVAAYLMRYEEYTLEEAEDFLCQKRDEIHIEEVQKKALREFGEK